MSDKVLRFGGHGVTKTSGASGFSQTHFLFALCRPGARCVCIASCTLGWRDEGVLLPCSGNSRGGSTVRLAVPHWVLKLMEEEEEEEEESPHVQGRGLKAGP